MGVWRLSPTPRRAGGFGLPAVVLCTATRTAGIDDAARPEQELWERYGGMVTIPIPAGLGVETAERILRSERVGALLRALDRQEPALGHLPLAERARRALASGIPARIWATLVGAARSQRGAARERRP